MDHRSATASRTPALRQGPSTEVGLLRALIARLLTLPNDTRAGLNAGARCAPHSNTIRRVPSSPWARSRHQAIRT